jgi:hypothetical protein
MKNRILIIPLLFLFFSVKGQSNNKVEIDSIQIQVKVLTKNLELSQNQILEQSKVIEELSKKLDYQGNQIESQTSILDTSFDGVSAQLSASSNFIGIFGVIIAIFSIGLSIYVGRIARNINQISQDNETLLQRNVTIKQDIEALSEKIVNDSKGLYSLMRTEEANHILDRLISVPEDISNMFSNLASRELDENHFLQLKEAYLQIIDQDEYADSYLIQFFQHFAGLAITDDSIKDKMISKINICVTSSFKNDIVKSTQDYFTALVKSGLDNSVSELNAFVKATISSKYKEMEEVYFSVFNSLLIRDNQFSFYRKIEKTDATKLFRLNFGKLLADYREDNPTADENLVFTELENLNQ